MHVNLLGGITLRLGNRVLDLSNKRAKALIGYLALAPDRSASRERLAGLLWSESEEGLARQSLRQVFADLRQRLGPSAGAIRIHPREPARLASEGVHCDVDDLLRELEAGRTPAVLLERLKITDSLMSGFEDIDPLFCEWLASMRQSLCAQITRTLQRRLHEAGTDIDAEAEKAALALRNLDLALEEPVRALMICRVAAGDTGGALKIYKVLWEHLATEFDSEPSQQTQDLAIQIRRAQGAEGNTASVFDPDRVPPAAMLAPGVMALYKRLVVSIGSFDVSVLTGRQKELAALFRQELIGGLTRFREWVILDQFVEGESAKDGGADYTVQVSACSVGRVVRLRLTLQDVRTGVYLWGERVDLSKSRWQSAQDEIVRWLSTSLNINLSVGRLCAIDRLPEHDLTANDLWLQGQSLFASFDSNVWDRAENLLKLAVTKAPAFAPAYSCLAQICNTRHLVKPGVFRDAKRVEQALHWAHHAVRLDTMDSRGQLCLAWSYAMARQYDQAQACARRAYELNENDPWTIVSSAACLAVCGDERRGRQVAELALRLPLPPSQLQWAYHTCIRFLDADYSGVVQAAQAAGDFSYVPAYAAAAMYHLGRPEEAREVLERWNARTRARWTGTVAASEHNILRWLLSIAPIRRPEAWERLRDGLVGLGAPVSGLTHASL